MGKGPVALDVGTSYIIKATETEEGINYVEFRDAFFRMTPATLIAAKMMEKGLASMAHFKDIDGSFVVVGEDAIAKAIERNKSVLRPLFRGVISPREPHARRVLKFILSQLVGKPETEGETLVYSCPAEPVDQPDENFNTGYHEDCLKKDLGELGWDAQSLNEGEAICYSELENDDYTGISCLLPGTQIYTKRGLVNIEDVMVGDEVVTHKGRWKKVTATIPSEFEGIATRVRLHGTGQEYNFVKNHEIYTQKDGLWRWTDCEKLEVGDILGEPVIYQNQDRLVPTLTLYDKATSSHTYTKTQIGAYPDVQRLIGYFLGDGSVNEAEGCIQWDFHKEEQSNIQDIQLILEKNFKKNSSITKKSENCTRVKCYSKAMISWFRNHLYDENKKKVYPWDLTRLNNNQCLSLLAGLIRSDGSISDKQIAFYNTNTNLIILAKQLFHRLGVAASLHVREPRSHFSKALNRTIEGKLPEWSVQTGSWSSLNGLSDILSNLSVENSKGIDRTFIDRGFACSRVTSVTHEKYKGLVYDVTVENDHSFCAPYITMHNCGFGAGMVNICVMSSGEPVVRFSLTRSGDWIDRMAAQSTGQPDSIVQVEKENGDFVVGEESDNSILSAVSAYYVRLIDYTIQHLTTRLARSDDLPKFATPIPIIVSGGTSRAKGFIRAFKKRVDQEDFPIQIKEVRHAKDPLRSVARGCLLAASM